MNAESKPVESVTCACCGGIEKLIWNASRNAELRERSLCFDCNFWRGIIDNQNSDCVRVNGEHYYIQPDLDCIQPFPDSFAGHGGAKFNIRFNDGRMIETRNLWSQGAIPDSFRSLLPDNARFLTKEEMSGYESIS